MSDLNIVEIKNEYTNCLVKNISPLLYEGIQSMYEDAKKFKNDTLGKDTNASVSDLFKHVLKETPKMTSNLLEMETNRIKTNCRCGEWFDDLIKAVVKSNIMLLTNTTSGRKGFDDEYHESVATQDFIHKCYIECSNELYNYPELFSDNLESSVETQNKIKAMSIIEDSVREAIRKLLPMKMILKEYLENNVQQFNNEKVTHGGNKSKQDLSKLLNSSSSRKSHHRNYSDREKSVNSYSESNVIRESDLQINKNINKELDREIEKELGIYSGSESVNEMSSYVSDEMQTLRSKLDELQNSLGSITVSRSVQLLKPGEIPPIENDPDFIALAKSGKLATELPTKRKTAKDRTRALFSKQERSDFFEQYKQ
jgi:hypothetical protein